MLVNCSVMNKLIQCFKNCRFCAVLYQHSPLPQLVFNLVAVSIQSSTQQSDSIYVQVQSTNAAQHL